MLPLLGVWGRNPTNGHLGQTLQPALERLPGHEGSPSSAAVLSPQRPPGSTPQPLLLRAPQQLLCLCQGAGPRPGLLLEPSYSISSHFWESHLSSDFVYCKCPCIASSKVQLPSVYSRTLLTSPLPDVFLALCHKRPRPWVSLCYSSQITSDFSLRGNHSSNILWLLQIPIQVLYIWYP